MIGRIAAIETIKQILQDVVTSTGSGGVEVSQLREIVCGLEEKRLDPEDSLLKAREISRNLKPVSH